MAERERNEIKSLLTDKQKEKCKQYVSCKDCPEFEKYYDNGMCSYVYFDEIKEHEEDGRK
jgi:hypothetical protein